MEWGDSKPTIQILAWKFPWVWAKLQVKLQVKVWAKAEAIVQAKVLANVHAKVQAKCRGMDKYYVVSLVLTLWKNTYEHESACVILTLFNILVIAIDL